MKHLKSYENVTSLKDYKKYIIVKSKLDLPYDTDLLLLEVIKINEARDSIYFIQHYHYNSKYNREVKDSTIYSRKDILYNMNHNWNILYTSDDLQECIEMLPLLYNTIKFNL